MSVTRRSTASHFLPSQRHRSGRRVGRRPRWARYLKGTFAKAKGGHFGFHIAFQVTGETEVAPFVTNTPLKPYEAMSVPVELRVLLSGHGTSRIGGEDGAVRDCIRSVLLIIQHELMSQDEIDKGPKSHLSLLAATSQGTDTLAHSIAEECGIELSIIAYSTVTTIPAGAVRTVTFGYDIKADNLSRLARAVALRDATALQFSDLVVIVWDGELTDDSRDGTARVLREALLARKCVIWINPLSVPEVKITCLQTLAKVDALNLPEELDPQTLKASFVSFTTPHDPNLAGIVRLNSFRTTQSEIEKLFERQSRRHRPGLLDRRARNLILMTKEKGKYEPRRSWPILPGAAWGSVPVFDDRFAQADVAANLAAGDFRTRTWLLYLLGALAVLLGAIGNLYHGGSGFQLLWHVGEILLVLSVLFVLWFKGGGKLHQRWTDLRSLAEHLRYQRFVYPLAGAIAPLCHPLWHVDSGGNRQISDSTAWLLHRLNVAAGLPALDRPVLDIAAALQNHDLKQELVSVVENQRKYHQDKMSSEGRLHHRLEVLSGFVFTLTLLAVIGILATPSSAFLRVCTVSLPALASALYAIGTQLELVRIAKQSEEQSVSLDRYLKAIEQVQENANRDPWLTAIEVRRLLIQSADLMVAEFAAWRALVRSHHLSL
jgi:hypothetical protein